MASKDAETTGETQQNLIVKTRVEHLAGEIRAGYGLKLCHIGMPIKELRGDWEPDREPDLAKMVLVNRLSGMYVQHEGGRITAIDFPYLSKELHPYHGATDRGVSDQSDVDDVQAKYGEPSYILKSIQSDLGEFPGASETTIGYVELGIRFYFFDDRLASIAVQSPQKDFDYDGFRKAMGKSLTFIRKQ